MLGRGGIGAVYLAYDSVLGRLVALKTLLSAALISEAAVTHLLEEAHTAARLKNPGLVAVYDAGCHTDGSPFFVMEYIEGRSLKEEVLDHAPDFARAADILAGIAEAVAYAHQHGFVHRDLKPGNVLLGRDGRVHVADFGLALHESYQRERRGEKCGTLHYLSPEQVRGESHRLDGRSDIWALGVMLYELLTRQRPFQGNTSSQIQDEILNRDPKPPRQIDETIPRRLEEICLRMLRKTPSERYQTAKDVADDLRQCCRDLRERSAVIRLSHPLILWVSAYRPWNVLERYSAAWKQLPESRNLPSVAQWIWIRALTARRLWTPDHHTMVKAADRFYRRRIVVGCASLRSSCSCFALHR